LAAAALLSCPNRGRGLFCLVAKTPAASLRWLLLLVAVGGLRGQAAEIDLGAPSGRALPSSQRLVAKSRQNLRNLEASSGVIPVTTS
jgi:hypothetical protein